MTRNDVIIGTWSFRTILEEGKLEFFFLQELEDNQINTFGLSETRWGKINGKDWVFKVGEQAIVFIGDKRGENGVAVIIDKKYAASKISYNGINDRLVIVKLNTKAEPLNLIQVYAHTTNHEDEEVQNYYNDQTVINKIPRREVIIIMGDLIA